MMICEVYVYEKIRGWLNGEQPVNTAWLAGFIDNGQQTLAVISNNNGEFVTIPLSRIKRTL